MLKNIRKPPHLYFLPASSGHRKKKFTIRRIQVPQPYLVCATAKAKLSCTQWPGYRAAAQPGFGVRLSPCQSIQLELGSSTVTRLKKQTQQAFMHLCSAALSFSRGSGPYESHCGWSKRGHPAEGFADRWETCIRKSFYIYIC